MTTNQDQKHEIDLLRRQLDDVRKDLNDARSNWENAVDAIREADAALETAEKVQAQLVAALQRAKKELYCQGVTERDMTDYGNGPAAYTVQAIETSLVAAGAAP